MSLIPNSSQKLPYLLIDLVLLFLFLLQLIQPDLPSSMYLYSQCLIWRTSDSSVSGGCLIEHRAFSVVALTTRLHFNQLLYWTPPLNRDLYYIPDRLESTYMVAACDGEQSSGWPYRSLIISVVDPKFLSAPAPRSRKSKLQLRLRLQLLAPDSLRYLENYLFLT